ncbi:MAG TPA: hypothetical protein VF384_11865 [Planctomycetota bacterium]
MPLLAQVPVPNIIVDVNEISNAGGMVASGPAGTASSLPNELSVLGTNRVWFAASSNIIGRELFGYRPDNIQTVASHNLLATPTLLSSDPCLLTPVGERLFFAAKDLSGEDRLHTLDAGDLAAPIPLPGAVTGTSIKDVSPMGTGAIVATFATAATTFWKVTVGTTITAQSIQTSSNYSLVGDLVDCGYDGSGFFAFTGLDQTLVPAQRVLATWSRGGNPYRVHTGAVDNLTAAGTKLYFTASTSTTSTLYKTTGGAEAVVHATGDKISHLMPASIGDSILFFLVTGSECKVHGYNGKDAPSVPWPLGWWVKHVTAATLVDDVPHVLCVGNYESAWYSAIWKVNDDGTAMELVKRLDGWGDCSQLVANGTGQLAFVGRYHETSPELRTPHLGFLATLAAPATPAPIPDLRAGAMPSSLRALADRVVFVADHRLQGIEPWYCTFPVAPNIF